MAGCVILYLLDINCHFTKQITGQEAGVIPSNVFYAMLAKTYNTLLPSFVAASFYLQVVGSGHRWICARRARVLIFQMRLSQTRAPAPTALVHFSIAYHIAVPTDGKVFLPMW